MAGVGSQLQGGNAGFIHSVLQTTLKTLLTVCEHIAIHMIFCSGTAHHQLASSNKPIPSQAGPAGTVGNRHGRAGKKRSASPARRHANVVVEHLRPVEDAGAPVPGGPLAGSALYFCDYGTIGKATLERLVARLGGTLCPYIMYIFLQARTDMRRLY